MSEKPKRQIHRDWNEAERERHGQQVRERFATEREKKFHDVEQAILEMLAENIPVSQNEVARRTGISVGFINKHLRDVISKAQQQQRGAKKNTYNMRRLNADLKELEKLRLTNSRLQSQLKEKDRANKALLAQVAKAVDLQDEVNTRQKTCKELHEQNKRLHAELQKFQSSSKIIDFPGQGVSTNVESELERIEIKLNSTLRQEIPQHSTEAVLEAIRAFEEYCSTHEVKSPEALLMQAIKGEWTPNNLDRENASEEQGLIPAGSIENSDSRNAEIGNLLLDLPDISNLSKTELVTVVAQQQEKIAQLRREIQQLKDNNGELKSKLVGIELLELENSELRTEKNRLFKLVTELRAQEDAKAEAGFAEALRESGRQPEFPEIEF